MLDSRRTRVLYSQLLARSATSGGLAPPKPEKKAGKTGHARTRRPVVTGCLTALVAVLVGVSSGSLRADDAAPTFRWPEKPGTAEHTFGGSDFIALNPAPLAGDGPFSISVWVNPTDLAAGDPTYGRGIARSTRGDKLGDWILSVLPDGRVRFINFRKNGEDTKGSHATRKPCVVADAWHHVVATWDGKENHIFVNAVEAPFDDTTTATGWGTGHEVGRGWTDPGYFWDGRIDDLRVYRRALSAEEIAEAAKVAPKLTAVAAAEPAGDAKVSQAIDRVILAKLKEFNLTPAPPADDAEFHRRVTLDLIGRVPTAAETEAFLADKADDKRTKLVESLLAGKEMPLAWSQILSNWVMAGTSRRDPQFLAYLRNGLAKNKSWDRFAREVVTARPEGSDDRGASLFLNSRKAAIGDKSIAKDVGRAFFGVNLRCAQCHDHPHVPEWTLERFYSLSAFFSRTFEHPYTDAQNQKRTVWAEKATGELEYTTQGMKKVAPLAFLDGTAVAEPMPPKDFKEPPLAKNAAPPEPPFSRREALAKAALGPQSSYFTRAIVNRVWKRLMGRGLVEPVDMMHEANAATHPELLDLLAADFGSHGCDLRRLVAVIMQSETYARSSRWPGKDAPPDDKLYAVALLKPLDADQMALSLPLATGYYDLQLTGPSKRSMVQLRSATPWKEVLAEFDADADEFEPTTSQALFLTNSAYVQTTFLAKSHLVQSLVAVKDDTEVARKAYLTVLSRQPTADEVAVVSRYLNDRGTKARGEACRELVWALLSGAEFRFNH